jgi:hypothetical protein
MSDKKTYRVVSKLNGSRRETFVTNEETGEELNAIQLDLVLKYECGDVKIEYVGNPPVVDETGEDAIRHHLTGFAKGEFSFTFEAEGEVK